MIFFLHSQVNWMHLGWKKNNGLWEMCQVWSADVPSKWSLLSFGALKSSSLSKSSIGGGVLQTSGGIVLGMFFVQKKGPITIIACLYRTVGLFSFFFCCLICIYMEINFSSMIFNLQWVKKNIAKKTKNQFMGICKIVQAIFYHARAQYTYFHMDIKLIDIKLLSIRDGQFTFLRISKRNIQLGCFFSLFFLLYFFEKKFNWTLIVGRNSNSNWIVIPFYRNIRTSSP